MSKGDLTLSVYSDFSKAFDIVQQHTIIQELHKIGFSTSALKRFISNLGNRSQYVQVNDSNLRQNCVILVLFRSTVINLYVNDLQDIDPVDLVKMHVNTLTILHNTSTSKSHRFDKLSKTLKSVWTI